MKGCFLNPKGGGKSDMFSAESPLSEGEGQGGEENLGRGPTDSPGRSKGAMEEQELARK